MAKLNKWERQHRKNLSEIERRIELIYEAAAKEAASIGQSIVNFSPDRLFSFDDYPITRKRIDSLLQGLKNDLSAAIVNGINASWTLSNNKNSELARFVFGDNVGKLSQSQYRRYFSTNHSAREAFINRKSNGLNLSDKVWRYTEQFKEEIELGLDVGLRNGVSAVDMTKELRQYLQHPDKLFRRVKDEHGVLQLSKRAKAFHPGQGVYRSSFKNARRLAATETNLAYRAADYTRWQDFDFVVGIEIKLSNNHTLNGVPFTDICDDLKGRYPKNFKFTGWHPLCRCHVETLLKTPEEMAEDNKRILAGKEVIERSVNTVDRMPEAFNEWEKKNEERMLRAKSLPYFIQDNKGLMNGFGLDLAIKETASVAKTEGNSVQNLAVSVAEKHGGKCTPINFKSEASIKRKVLADRLDTPNLTPNDLKDTVRTTVIVEKQNIQAVIDDFSKTDNFIRHKPQNTPLGYTGHIINIRTESGLVAEIQVNTARVIYAKESPEAAKSIIGEKLWYQIRKETGLEGGLGHKYYEQWRVLNPESKEAIEIMKKSREYYSHFTN